MKYYIYRNTTVENLFKSSEYSFSGYNDISMFDDQYDMYVWLYFINIHSNNSNLEDELASYFQNINFVLKQINPNKPFIIFTLRDFFPLKFQNNDFSNKVAIDDFNEKVVELSKQYENIKIVDIADFTDRYPISEIIDWKYYFMSKIQMNPKLSASFYTWFTKQIDAIEFKRKKCLILDLDNTLWSGILGEDGPEGIKIGGDYPGNAFLMFQESLIELNSMGVLLAICSKNNEKDVFELWATNPFIKLKRQHFSAMRINWNDKALNIKEIAEELNIGLDSLVFVDDNPAERELVMQLLPQVEVPDFPKKPYELALFFSYLLRNYFAIYNLTNEDKQKVNQYKANTKRLIVQNSFDDFNSFLSSLEMSINIVQANRFNIPRIAQMSQKTNQFNLTTKRYTESDIHTFVKNGNSVYCIDVTDKFGNQGITGVIILKYLAQNKVEIDSFFLSCRILGKNIEVAFLDWVLNHLKNNQVELVVADYIPSNKNSQVKDFYLSMGFSIIEHVDERSKYELNLTDKNFSIANYFKIIYNESETY